MPEKPVPSPELDVVEMGDQKTPAHGIATPEYVKRKLKAELETARRIGSRQAKVTGLLWGGGLVVTCTTIAFLIWFKAEASAQEKSDKAEQRAIAAADAGVDRKLAPLATELAVLKSKVDDLGDDVAELKKASDKSAEQQAEMLRLLRKR